MLVGKQALRAELLGNSGHLGTLMAGQRNDFLSLKINARLNRCGREVRMVLPAGSTVETPAHPSPSLVKAVTRAYDWVERIIRGELSGTRSIARTTGLDERYVSRILHCAFLAPDIVESIVEGRQPPHLALENLRIRIPIDWGAQRRVFGFSAK